MDAPRTAVEQIAFPATDRRKTERRGMDALRSEALKALITKVEDKNFGGLRNRVSWRPNIAPSRLILLGVALLAGGLAAFLATQHEQPAPVAVATVEAKVPTTQILVAKQPIGVGQRLSPAALQWEDWPQTALRPEFITVAATPDAMTAMGGSVARSDFVAGEPILQQKLAPAGEGYLSAILASGKRGVSVSIAAESASGGFVVPNDHVDVVLTRASATGQDSQTILENVRVLAINARLGKLGPDAAPAAGADPSSEVFSNQAIATLELDPAQAEVIINATTSGKLSLVLRASADSTDTGAAEQHAINAAIRISSPFWTNSTGTAAGGR